MSHWKRGLKRLYRRSRRPLKRTKFYHRRYYRWARALLGDTIDILNQADIDYHLDYGTLLGVVRGGDLISWDGDLDIGVLATDWPALEATYDAFRERGWRVPHTKYQMGTDGLAWRAGDPKQITIATPVLLPTTLGRVRMDVVAKYADDDHLWWYCGHQPCRAPAAYFAGRREIAFAGRATRIPTDAEAYLSLIYGDWRTPRRDYVTHRDDGSMLRLDTAGPDRAGTSDELRNGS